MRHELRTPINHILGYTEMLMEEGQLPASFTQDLKRIHSGGRQLQALIAEYFDEEKFFTQRDLHQLYHELRTPVNHIIGYSELLQEQAAEQGVHQPIADLKKIHAAAGEWLSLMEAYLIESPADASAATAESDAVWHPLTLNSGLGFKVPEPKTAAAAFSDEGAILIVDDDEQNRDMLARRLRRCGYTISTAPNGVQALQLARSQQFDLIMLDMIMPGLDGFQVLARFKDDPALRETPVIMLSALDEENGIARCIEMGAEDYLAKPFNPIFLRARIGACLEKKRLRDRERATHEALQRSQKQLAGELAEAADYVRSILPPPLSGAVEAEWCFQPSEQLGGDAFGYHWVDEAHFAIYLLDVCGHGVGAALLSLSVLNTLRSQSLPGVDFRYPSDVLSSLNRTFRMESQNQLFFTVWYGVYRVRERELVFSSGGHPPALLINSRTGGRYALTQLRTAGPAIGCLEEAQFTSAIQSVLPGARLLVLSDGVFEIFQGNDRVGTWEEFVANFKSPEFRDMRPADRLGYAQKARGAEKLEDDFSVIEARFP
jgi:sigma-B regulation protein RsbU (phosphoserine phosphatase)